MAEQLPTFPAGSGSVVLSRATYQKLRDAAAFKITPDSADFEATTRANELRFRLRPTDPKTQVGGGTLPPFYPLLGTNEGETPTYFVTVTHGLVYERDLKKGLAENAIIPHYCPARLDGTDPREFPIADGKSICVLVRQNPSGSIGATSPDVPVDLVVVDTDTISTNYIPDEQAGLYYYELARFTVTAGVPELTIIRGGSHIDITSGLTADVVFRDCNGDPLAEPDPIPGTQILRETYLTGVLISLDKTIAERALAPAAVIKEIPSCCYVGPPP